MPVDAGAGEAGVSLRPPLVSVVMPVRNGEKFLVEAIRSVLRQSLRDLELVVVDDGSTDSSAALADAEAARDGRVRVVRWPGGGISAATNLGLASCRGSFIARMDQDDLCRPDRLERQVAFFGKHPEVGVVGGQIRRFGAPNLRQGGHPTGHAGIQAAAVFCCPLHGSTVLFRSSLAPEREGLYDSREDFSEDYGLWTRWLLAGVRFAVLPEVVLDYRVHPGQASARFTPRQSAVSDGIRLRWLRRMGLEPGPEDLQLHCAASEGRWGRGTDYLAALEGWFLKLRSAGLASDFLEPAAFDAALAQRWTSALWANRGLGRPLFRLAQDSPLSRLPHPNAWKPWAARWGSFLPAAA